MATYGHAATAGGLNGIAAESWVVSGSPSKVIIACSYLFVASYAPTWGPVSWVYPPELFPLRVRGKAVALTTSANWAFNFALGYFVPPAFQNIQVRLFLSQFVPFARRWKFGTYFRSFCLLSEGPRHLELFP
jgi:hypothetical protein